MPNRHDFGHGAGFMEPYRIGPEGYALTAVMSLLQNAFEGMTGRIDPPSSMNRLTHASLARQAETGEIWAIGAPPLACLCLTPLPDALYLAKLATDPDHRGRGLASALIALAQSRAGALGLPRLRLQCRIELIENHAAFAAMGFAITGETRHEGYDRPTSLTFEKDLR